jgi:hypothetical protein
MIKHFAAAVLLLAATHALANHGPSSSGGGAITLSGETLRQGKFEVTIREDFTQFERFTRSEVASIAASGEEIHALRRSFVTSAAVAYGITDDFQVGIASGYDNGWNFLDGHAHGEHVSIGSTNPDGFLDTTLTLKYRILQGAPGNLSLLTGIKMPTGRDDIRLSNNHPLHASDQPGTGSWDVPFGIAYSRFLTDRITIDASAAYMLRTEHDDFQVGDRLDLSAALAYRLTDSIRTFPQFSVFGELLFVHIQKDREAGETDPNSGSATLYLSPGLRVRFTENVAFTIAPAMPLYQHVNGLQGEVEFKMTAALSVGF